MNNLQQTHALANFRCTGDACPDTCCKGWSMLVTEETEALYAEQAPELLDALMDEGGIRVMRRNPVTDYCIKLDKGWCGIHAAKGEDFLGDACYFFPRVTRALGAQHVMTASLGCPETARLFLYTENATAYSPNESPRLPYSMKDYLPEGMAAESAWAMHNACMTMVREASSAEHALVKLNALARALDTMPVAQWEAALPFYMTMLDGRVPAPEPHVSDPFHLLNALQGLIGATAGAQRERLMAVLGAMERALATTLDWQTLGIQLSEGSAVAYVRMESFWRTECQAHYAPVLKRWLESQMALALFPFAGFGRTLADRVTVIGVRFATVTLALMALAVEQQRVPSEEDTVRVIQTLARFTDHLADPTLSMKIYSETGWVREARLRALLRY